MGPIRLPRRGGQAALLFSPPFFLPPPVINKPKIDPPVVYPCRRSLMCHVFDPLPGTIESQPHAIAGS